MINNALRKMLSHRGLGAMIFAFALLCRVVDFNSTSVTNDELSSKDSGPWLALLKKGDFISEEWGYNKQYSIILRWTYGVLPQVLFGTDPGNPYDLAGPRLIGAVLGSALVWGVFLLGRQYGGAGVGVLSALVYSLFPGVLGHDRFAAHDLPARMASLAALLYMGRHFKTHSRRALLWSAFWAAFSFAAYFRVGVQTIFILQAGLIWRCLAHKKWTSPETTLSALSFPIVAAIGGYLLFVITWPYAWWRPIEAFNASFATGVHAAAVGGNQEWFFGKIVVLPWSYYPAVYIFMMPLAILLALVLGMLCTWKECLRGEIVLLLWLNILIPLVTMCMALRSSLNHYLLICYPPTCILAAIGIVGLAGRLRRWGSVQGWKVALGSAVLVCEIVIGFRIHPWHLEFFNSLVGGTAGVSKNHTFALGWYGEAIQPLFDYVNQNAPPNSTITVRLGGWPGLFDLKRNLRKDLQIQGYTALHPLGADYVLRTGAETCNQFYRWNPNPALYDKAMDVTAMGGSLGDVWKRRDPAALSDLLYSDDFSSPQITRLAIRVENMSVNIFSDGKLYSVEPNRPAALLIQIPAGILRGQTLLRCQADVQMNQGGFSISVGVDPAKLEEVSQVSNFKGSLESQGFQIKPGKDLFIELRWITNYRWNGGPQTFWEADWIDGFRILSRKN